MSTNVSTTVHGTLAGYNNRRCRCPDCKAAKAASRRAPHQDNRCKVCGQPIGYRRRYCPPCRKQSDLAGKRRWWLRNRSPWKDNTHSQAGYTRALADLDAGEVPEEEAAWRRGYLYGIDAHHWRTKPAREDQP